jgi:uncharacterized protein (DUF849 family)
VSTAVITAALTGPIATKDDNPNLPTTPEEMNLVANARTGMEDTLMLRRGVPAAGNGELAERLVGVALALDREPASVAEARERLHLSTSEPAR